ncbi:MAG: RHS repeat-associated core domain-containing protein [Planctomycetaceae bacterium]|nr:RHS repeat-associated core domain-containing protein [Planctomycetaceae bacterium]
MDDAWTLRDHLNTVRNVIDMNGKTISHLQYNAFGKLISSTGEKLPFRYTGKMFDDATGLQWNINRWYDANVGRWISEDPIGFMGRDGNLSRYVNNAPTMGYDCNGHCWCKAIVKCFTPALDAMGAFAVTAYTLETCLKAVAAAPGASWKVVPECTLLTGGSAAVTLATIVGAMHACISLANNPDCDIHTKKRIQAQIDTLVDAIDTIESIGQQIGINLF